MTDLDALFQGIKTKPNAELTLDEKALLDEYAFYPYVEDNIVKNIAYGITTEEDVQRAGCWAPSTPSAPNR